MISGPAHRDVRAEPAAAGSAARRRSAGRAWIPALAVVCVLGAIATLLALSLSSSSTSPSLSSSGPSLHVANSALGEILVEQQGRTLYLFKRDGSNTSSCTGACARVWPPATVAGKPTLGAGVARAKLTTIRRPDGTNQLAYYGHPLYRFSEDTHPGQLGGVGFLGAWFAVSPTGRALGKAGVVGGYS